MDGYLSTTRASYTGPCASDGYGLSHQTSTYIKNWVSADIFQQLELRIGSEVVESGTGSGSITKQHKPPAHLRILPGESGQGQGGVCLVRDGEGHAGQQLHQQGVLGLREDDEYYCASDGQGHTASELPVC